MTDERAARLDKWLEEEVAANGELSPPWVKFPTYGRGSLGWRMGAGEHWLELWWLWMSRLPSERQERLGYLKRHGAAPEVWGDVVWTVLTCAAAEELEQSQVGEIRSLGLIADDAAYLNWRAGELDERPVWELFDGPAEAVRYADRELTFWCRLVSEDRARAEIEEPPAAWRAFFDTARTGRFGESVPDVGQGWARLAFQLAAEATAPPPWMLGVELEAFTDSLDMDAGYVDAWGNWAFGVFESRRDWEAYLSKWEKPTTKWLGFIAENVIFF